MIARRTPALTDSAWFWACAFSTAALIALVAMEPKYGVRQSQIEQQFQGREFSTRGEPGTEAAAPFSTPDATLIRLRPLYWLFAAVLSITWGLFWWQRRKISQIDPQPGALL